MRNEFYDLINILIKSKLLGKREQKFSEEFSEKIISLLI